MCVNAPYSVYPQLIRRLSYVWRCPSGCYDNGLMCGGFVPHIRPGCRGDSTNRRNGSGLLVRVDQGAGAGRIANDDLVDHVEEQTMLHHAHGVDEVLCQLLRVVDAP